MFLRQRWPSTRRAPSARQEVRPDLSRHTTRPDANAPAQARPTAIGRSPSSSADRVGPSHCISGNPGALPPPGPLRIGRGQPRRRPCRWRIPGTVGLTSTAPQKGCSGPTLERRSPGADGNGDGNDRHQLQQPLTQWPRIGTWLSVTPEKRKVDGSTPPRPRVSDHCKR